MAKNPEENLCIQVTLEVDVLRDGQDASTQVLSLEIPTYIMYSCTFTGYTVIPWFRFAIQGVTTSSVDDER